MLSISSQVFRLGQTTFNGLNGQYIREQGGLLSGKDPTQFDIIDPIRLWIIQLGVILVTTQILALVLRRIRQPKVIAEVMCGIVLGPTIMGKVPGFAHHVFPEESKSYLSLTANIGLVLFLFLVGLEIDMEVIKRNAKNSGIISVGGILLPFAMGMGMALPIYNNFIDPTHASFGQFSLFVAVAYCITAFPVLCRILTELKLLDTTLGVIVLSVGVFNDIIGWTLLALTIALVNAGSGFAALNILLVAITWTLVILLPIKRSMLLLARWTGSIENGPTPFMMTASLMLCFGSALFTDIIGVHAIFGAFLAGLAIPHDGGLAIALMEKLEDLTSIVFLPLYFTLSGLSTDLSLLNNGKTWIYTIAIIVTAYLGKFFGGTAGARWAGFGWRESATVGTLLSCKGLVELIVLNVGLTAGILDTRVFSMFVLEALVLTFMTTPVTLWLYPAHYRTRVTSPGSEFLTMDVEGSPKPSQYGPDSSIKRRFTVVLDKMEHLPALMAFTTLLHPSNAAEKDVERQSFTPSSFQHQSSSSSSSSIITAVPSSPPVSSLSIDALRLIELTERTSVLMRSSMTSSLLHTDPLLSVYRTFGELAGVCDVSPSLDIVTKDSFPGSVATHALSSASDMVVVAWVAPTSEPQEQGNIKLQTQTPTSGSDESGTGPLDALFGVNLSMSDPSAVHSQFIRRVFKESMIDVALYVDREKRRGGAFGTKRRGQHILLPYFGGPDDRLALSFVVQLCAEEGVTATVVRVHKTEVETPDSSPREILVDIVASPRARTVNELEQRDALAAALHARTLNTHLAAGVEVFPDTVYPDATTQMRVDSNLADNIAWMRYASPDFTTTSPPEALSRIEFTTVSTSAPLQFITQMAESYDSRRLLIVVGRGRRLAAESHWEELKEMIAEHGQIWSEARKTVGDVAAGVLAGSKNRAAVLVLQSAGNA